MTQIILEIEDRIYSKLLGKLTDVQILDFINRQIKTLAFEIELKNFVMDSQNRYKTDVENYQTTRQEELNQELQNYFNQL